MKKRNQSRGNRAQASITYSPSGCQNHNFEGRGKEEESSNFTRAKIMKGSPFEEKKKKEKKGRKEGGKGGIIFYLLICKCN